MNSTAWLSTEGVIEEALPVAFDFYGQGEIRALSTGPTPSEKLAVISYQLHGDLQGWLLIFIERHHDLSMYSEVGNILASTLANELQARNEIRISIAPPHRLTVAEAEALDSVGTVVSEKVYGHFVGSSLVRIHMKVLAHTAHRRGNGNA